MEDSAVTEGCNRQMNARRNQALRKIPEHNRNHGKEYVTMPIEYRQRQDKAFVN